MTIDNKPFLLHPFNFWGLKVLSGIIETDAAVASIGIMDRLSRFAVETNYLTAMAAVKQHLFPPDPNALPMPAVVKEPNPLINNFALQYETLLPTRWEPKKRNEGRKGRTQMNGKNISFPANQSINQSIEGKNVQRKK